MNLISSIHDAQEGLIEQNLLCTSFEQVQINSELTLNTDSYSARYFEEYIGMEPSHPEDYIYWSGYEIGSREYWANRLGVEIPTEF